MKIALCLHGMFDSPMDTTSTGLDGREYIQKHILDKGDVDIFIHSWDLEKQGLIEAIYQPKKSVFEPQKDFSSLIEKRGLDKLQGCPRPPQSVLSHLYSVNEVMKMPHQQTGVKYDIIIKARFDLGRINRNTSGPGLGNPYPVQCINFQTDIQNDKIYMANWNHFHMGPADMWFYGSPSVMVEFNTLYNDLENQMFIDSEFHKFAKEIEGNEGDLSNAIAFYKWWMIRNELWNNRINLDTIWE
jgi:hypothetical protein